MRSRRNQFLTNALVFFGIAMYGAAEGRQAALVCGILGTVFLLMAAVHRTREDNRAKSTHQAEGSP